MIIFLYSIGVKKYMQLHCAVCMGVPVFVDTVDTNRAYMHSRKQGGQLLTLQALF